LDEIMRRVLSFTCEGALLAATLDESSASTGLLIVSGGNEVRIGAHRGMAKLARDISAEGFAVFRYDRRGIGDSEGENGGFEKSEADIAAAIRAFKAECPHLDRIIAFGNCDAATALRLHLEGNAEVSTLILANPWVLEESADAPSPAVVRAYYWARLRNPRAWIGFLKGAVDLSKLFGGLRAASKQEAQSSLAARMAHAMKRAPIPTKIILAAHDGTAVAFKAQWDSSLFDSVRDRIPVLLLESPSHSFVSDADYSALKSHLCEELQVACSA
jgi:exosortase A-associated hydrolase 1